MDPRELVRNNGYIGPASFSVGMQYMNLAPTNWGVPAGPLFVVMLDPQVDVGRSLLGSSSEALKFDLRSEVVTRRVRRKLMAELTSEFSTSNDELLRELAR